MKLQRYFRGQIKMIFSKYAMYMKKFGGILFFRSFKNAMECGDRTMKYLSV